MAKQGKVESLECECGRQGVTLWVSGAHEFIVGSKSQNNDAGIAGFTLRCTIL